LAVLYESCVDLGEEVVELRVQDVIVADVGHQRVMSLSSLIGGIGRTMVVQDGSGAYRGW